MTDPRGPLLLRLARDAIVEALDGPPVHVPEGAPWLSEPGACFVTIHRAGDLHGCIGSLVAHRPLVDDVRANAVAAALQDPRATPLSLAGVEELVIEVSLLSELEPLPVADELDAIEKLRPFVDGIVLRWGLRRGTLLPQVWESIPEPKDFLVMVKRKAGLDPHFWADDVRLERYTVEKFSEEPHADEGPIGHVPDAGHALRPS
jgi:hypothetical protein